ncbi:hypothetical protein I317_03769 [Kwoniella heveanensis CBS 569]|uniref:protein-histidine N-methyltransferase n=1 Tax=Kwoniella heveanensis BCC8398 TaxID=1296120 RepID=A0A1B9GUI0_9TREE|nr:hypothetical protein I316_03737 [Kwoniella heveanensis BCC8398]OCF42394.1 hypothetical protein I317_03769 [Kwoniella heveanensis CBS 569]
MFKFDFQLEEEDEDVQIPSLPTPTAGPSTTRTAASIDPTQEKRSLTDAERCHDVSLDELLKSLPVEISYSPLYHSSLETPLLRRDLFDARFQLYNRAESTAHPDAAANSDPDPTGNRQTEQAGNAAEGDEYVDAQTDLIPGLYEGGLKSWEGGVDLVEVLNGVGVEGGVGEWVRGGRVLEVGCGTSLPTAYLLRSLLSIPPATTIATSTVKTTFHLQDYNSLVLSLVSLPNLILAALPFLPTEVLHAPDEEEDVEAVLPDLEQPGNIHITPALIEAFKALLQEKNVELVFTYGHWAGLAAELQDRNPKDSQRGAGYGLILTAETIYAEESHQSLLDVLRAGLKKGTKGIEHVDVGLEESLGDLKVGDEWKRRPLRDGGDGFVLVAAKVLYFGVGGGLQGFLERVKASGGWYKNVKEWVKGVGRKVVQVGW